MPLINHTYFIGALTIGDISQGNSPVVGNTVNATFIPKYEKDYLLKALGYPLYKAFTEGLEEDPIAQKWLDLRDGVDYTVNDRLYRWDGFVNDEKVSPIANYVFCEYLTVNAVQSMGVGTAANDQQNATRWTPADKIQRVWSDMQDMNDSLEHYLYHHKDEYPEYHETDWYYWRLWYADIRRRFGSRNSFNL